MKMNAHGQCVVLPTTPYALAALAVAYQSGAMYAAAAAATGNASESEFPLLSHRTHMTVAKFGAPGLQKLSIPPNALDLMWAPLVYKQDATRMEHRYNSNGIRVTRAVSRSNVIFLHHWHD